MGIHLEDVERFLQFMFHLNRKILANLHLVDLTHFVELLMVDLLVRVCEDIWEFRQVADLNVLLIRNVNLMKLVFHKNVKIHVPELVGKTLIAKSSIIVQSVVAQRIILEIHSFNVP
jgi:hypothetical protein